MSMIGSMASRDSAEAARREARIWLYVRGTAHEGYVRDVLDEDEAQIVIDHRDAFRDAWYNKSPDIAGVPDSIVDKMVDRAVSASPSWAFGSSTKRLAISATPRC